MATSETGICNLALARIGANRINDIAENSVEAIQCRAHYEVTRDALLRGHTWKFAMSRAALSLDTGVPAFEWAHQYELPSNLLRFVGLYEVTAAYALEGNMLLTDEAEANIWYIKQVTDVTQFEPLFVELLALSLALKLCVPLSQDKRLYEQLYQEKQEMMSQARLANRIETNTVAKANTWIDARITGT
jgi:hypothetical protein